MAFYQGETITQPNGDTFRSCSCMRLWWPLLNRVAVSRGIVKQQVDVVQGSYNTSVNASAKTHAGGGVLDLSQYTESLDALLEEAGAASYVRTRQDGFDPHIHMVLIGCPHLHPQALAQVTDWRNNKNALASHAADGDTTRPATIRTWRQGASWLSHQFDSEDIPMEQDKFNSLMNGWANTKEGKLALTRAVLNSGTYGDVNNDGVPETPIDIIKHIAESVNDIHAIIGRLQ